MSVVLYAESSDGKFKKVALELASYAKAVADALGTQVTAVTINASDASELGKYGVTKVLQVQNDALKAFNAKAYADVIQQAARQEGAQVVVFSSSTDSLYVAPLVAVALEAGMASNVVSAPLSTAPFQVKRSAFSQKAFNYTTINTSVKVLSISKNSFGISENATNVSAEAFTPQLNDGDFATKVAAVEKASGQVSIADADIVISGGRGLKGPENWHILEDLATTLGAATACSKPVSDIG
uniref:electron transfer flavoprotein subunit alpha/FixB family protein n=1 Tax=Flavobacterium sp. TaxID=239 RepID=UPI00260E1CD3